MTVEPELSRIVCQLVQMVAPEQREYIGLDDQLVGDLGFHSLAMVELAFAIENLFAMEDTPMEQAADIKSVGDIPPIVLSALDQSAAKMPSAAALADFAAQYGFAWEANGDGSSATR